VTLASGDLFCFVSDAVQLFFSLFGLVFFVLVEFFPVRDCYGGFLTFWGRPYVAGSSGLEGLLANLGPGVEVGFPWNVHYYLFRTFFFFFFFNWGLLTFF